MISNFALNTFTVIAHFTSTDRRTPTKWSCWRATSFMCWRYATTAGSWARHSVRAASAPFPATMWNEYAERLSAWLAPVELVNAF